MEYRKTVERKNSQRINGDTVGVKNKQTEWQTEKELIEKLNQEKTKKN